MSKRLYTIGMIKDSLNRAGRKPKKSLGQNFLADGNIVEKIADVAEVNKEDIVLEIGPGIGTLTEELAIRAKRVIAIEIDQDLIPVLKENLSKFDNIEIIEGDILDLDLEEIFKEYKELKVIANLPYYITTPIITKIADFKKAVSLTLMMQKEVAERLCAGAKDSAYGSLSVFVNTLFEPEISFIVPRNVFIPSPKIESAVMIFKRIENPITEDKNFFEFVQGAFALRRKTLINSLSHSMKIDKDEIRKALDKGNYPHNIRAEALENKELLEIYRNLKEEGESK